MSPTPGPDVVVDLAVVRDDAARPAPNPRDTYSWDLDGDVLRDLLLRAG